MQQLLSFVQETPLTSGSKSETPPCPLPFLDPAEREPIHEGAGLILGCQFLSGQDHRPKAMELVMAGFVFTRRPQSIVKGLLGIVRWQHPLDQAGPSLPRNRVVEARRLIHHAEFILPIDPECDATALRPWSSDLKGKPWVFPSDRISWVDLGIRRSQPYGECSLQGTVLEDAFAALIQLNALTPLGLTRLHLLLHRSSCNA